MRIHQPDENRMDNKEDFGGMENQFEQCQVLGQALKSMEKNEECAIV